MKEGIDMSQNLQHVDVTTDIEEFMLFVESNRTDSNYTMRFTDNSKEVPYFIAGFIAHKSKRITKDCCEYLSTSSENHSNRTYLHELSRRLDDSFTKFTWMRRPSIFNPRWKFKSYSEIQSAVSESWKAYFDNGACAQHQEVFWKMSLAQ